MREKISILKNSLKIIFIDELIIFLKNLSKLFVVSKKKFLLTIFVFISIISLVTILNYKLFKYIDQKTNEFKTSFSQESISTTDNSLHSGELIYNALEGFGETYKKIITTFEPIFENFISSTSDVTGKSQKFLGGFTLNVLGYSDIEMSSGAKVRSALYYASRLNLLVVPIMTILIVIYVFNSLIDFENSKFSLIPIFTRVITTVVLLIITPIILSLTIQGANLLTKFFLEENTIFEFIKSFFDELVKPTQNTNSLQELIQNFLSSNFSPIAFFQILPVAIPLMIILLQIIYISLQFIIRYVNMYFLACIYPLAVVFNIHPKTTGISQNFWKTWITLIIHQPFFILGYVIIQNMLSEMLKTGVSLEQIILFVGLLLFLSSINIVVAKIFGDVFTAVSNNIIAATGTALINRYSNIKSRFITKKKVSKKTTIGKSITGFAGAATKLIS